MALQVVSSAPKLADAGQIFWIGNDGNVYLKGTGGNSATVTNDGKANGTGTTANLVLNGAKQIANPSVASPKAAAAVTGPADPNDNAASGGSSGGSSASTFEDKSNDLAIQNAGLAATDTQTNSAVAKINASLASILGGYDTESAANNANYTTQSNNNQNALETNKQTAEVNAATGRQGLLGTLASIGALSGSGLTEANNAVQHGANEDLTTAGNTFDGNKTSLDTALSTYNAADAARRKDANTAAGNDIESAQNAGDQTKQNFLSAIANDYDAEGDKANAAKYTSMAAALYPDIANTAVPTQSLSAETAAYSPSALANANTASNTVVSTSDPTTTGGIAIPGLVAATKKQVAPVVAA